MRRVLSFAAIAAVGWIAAGCSSSDQADGSGGGSNGGASSASNGGASAGASNGGASAGASNGGASAGASNGGSSDGGSSGGAASTSSASTAGTSAGTASSGTGGTGGTASSGGDSCPEGAANLCGILAAHNRVRAAAPGANPPLPALVWDADLAAHAQAWADTCPTGHNMNRTVNGETVGENIYWTSSTSPAPSTAAVDAWASEGTGYDEAANTCEGAPYTTSNFNCGHYTQMVWRSTMRVGCGMRTGCPAGTYPQPWVCNYAPAGNIVDSSGALERPY